MNNIPVIDMTATGENIARLRIRAGLSVRDLQEIFGFCTPQAIYKWQRGTALPTIDNLVVLAAVLNIILRKLPFVSSGLSVILSAVLSAGVTVFVFKGEGEK